MLDEAIALPTKLSARIPRNKQMFLQEETESRAYSTRARAATNVESLTHELMEQAWHHIQEIESLGGMARGIETCIPKMRIEEAAARRQAQIDCRSEIMVGPIQAVGPLFQMPCEAG